MNRHVVVVFVFGLGGLAGCAARGADRTIPDKQKPAMVFPVVVGQDPTIPSTLEVCVRAALTQEALRGATVVVDSETGLHERIGIADSTGKAEFKGLPAGEYRVTVYYSSHLERRLREVLESERVGVDVDIPLPSGHAGGGQACSSEGRGLLAPSWRR